MSIFGIDPISAIVSGINAINGIRLDKIEEKALLEEVLEELRRNLQTIKDDYLKNKVSIDKITGELAIQKLEAAERARKRKKLDFNKIKEGPIDKTCFVSLYQYSKYKDFDTEKIFLKIRDKVKDLSKAKRLYFNRGQWSNKVNPISRMNNLVGLFILLANHLSMGKSAQKA